MPFKSIVSKINNNKSSFSKECLDTLFSLLKNVIVLVSPLSHYNRIMIPFF